MQCLNISNKQVKAELDELTQALGSYDAAYYVMSENNGYSLDKAPNGADSKLFQSLLDSNKGDRQKAFLEKAKVYSKSFRLWFVDWVNAFQTNKDNKYVITFDNYKELPNDSAALNDVSKVVDENGEPTVDAVTEYDLEKPRLQPLNDPLPEPQNPNRLRAYR